MTRVLVVDDEPSVVRSLCRGFGPGVDADGVTRASLALERLEKEQFDVLLTDYEMPLHDGLWLLREAHVRALRPRRLLMSGVVPPLLNDHLRSGVVHAFLPKPFTSNEALALFAPALLVRA